MTLGIIGGLGPIATAYYMELIIKMTDASCDQEHLEMIIYNSPRIPDRTAYILGQSQENPVDEMVSIGRKLAEQGAGCIGIPCVTAHYFHEELSKKIPVPIIQAIYETGVEIQKYNIKRVGIMATDGTVESRIFQRELEKLGMQAVLPDEAEQGYVMDLIYKNVKAGKAPDMEKFGRVSNHLREKGAQVIVLGCTELSLIKKEYEIGPGFADAMEILAQRSVIRCGGKLKKEYQNLIEF